MSEVDQALMLDYIWTPAHYLATSRETENRMRCRLAPIAVTWLKDLVRTADDVRRLIRSEHT